MRIGIITHFYNSINYGGTLQAYALTEFLNKFNLDSVEQIQFECKVEKVIIKKNKTVLERIQGKKINLILYLILRNSRNKYNAFRTDKIKHTFDKRRKLFKQFQELIPHTDGEVYTCENISELNSYFDYFITGSDQVWNPNWFESSYYLDFVNDNSKKISYAASIGVSEYSDGNEKNCITLINEINHISVREEEAKILLSKYIDRDIFKVVDPVLLLEEPEWSQKAVSVVTNTKYVYSYLLGEKKYNRRIANKIANKLKLNLVTIPYEHMSYKPYNSKFGDIQIYDAGPSEFLGLIKDSEIIVTDSFHAIVFSVIFKKKFFALRRYKDSEKGNMNVRIESFLRDINLLDRLIDEQDKLTLSQLKEEIDYKSVEKIITSRRIESIEFLKNAFHDSTLNIELEEYLKLKKGVNYEN